MTSLQQRLQDDIKNAMKAGKKDELELLRMLASDVKNAAIRDGGDRSAVPDDVVQQVLRKGVKSRAEAAALYEQGGRQDLVDKEVFQIGILERYLPAQAAEDEVVAVVDAVIAELGVTDKKGMGLVMKAALIRLEGRADGKSVSRIVGTRLP